MKLTKYEQETIILYNQAENTASICTHDADLKRRFTKYSKNIRLEKVVVKDTMTYTLIR